MPFPTEVIRLSWNNARLVALILNSIVGILTYFEDAAISDPNSLFAIRLAHNTLNGLELNFKENGLHVEIFKEVRNLSDWTERLILHGQKRLMNRDPDGLEQVNFLIERFAFDFQPYRKLDERWRWHDKEHVELNAVNGWLNKYDKVGYYACFLQLSNCSISEQCQSLLTEKGRISSNAVKQLLLIAGAKAKNCDKKLEKVLKFAPPGPKVTPSNLNDLTAELCTNLFDETSRIRKDKKKLASLEIGAVESLTEQMFVCTMFGFVEFVDINTIELILAWQHPRKGCYTSAKPDPMPKHGIIEPFDQFGDVLHESSRKQDACIDHQTAAAVNALAMVLKTLFDPPPWPDQRINLDNMLQQHLHQIPSEDRFHTFKYVNWVRDANLPDQYRLPRPPPNAWSPDLIAFVCLGFALLAISVCAHHIFSARNHPAGIGPPPKNLKQYYAYAYKKL